MYGFIREISRDWRRVQSRIQLEKENVLLLLSNDTILTLVNCLISAEDHRFRFHLGFDVIAIGRAIKNNTLYKKREGASTISQQLVRVITNDFRNGTSRKIKEIVLAIFLTFVLSKRLTALVYINIAYYGTEFNGLNQILKRFNLEPNSVLTLDVCCEIVSRLKYPEPRDQKNSSKMNLINRRKEHVFKLYKKHSRTKFLKYHE